MNRIVFLLEEQDLEKSILVLAYPQSRQRTIRELGRRRFRNPDSVVRPSDAISMLIPEFQKRSGARRMAEFLSRNNRSRSFQVFAEGIEGLWASMQTAKG